MKNEILDLIKDLSFEQVRKFKNSNKELENTHHCVIYAFETKKTLEEVAERLVVSVSKNTTDLSKLITYFKHQQNISNRKLLTFDSFQAFLKYREANPTKKFGNSWKNGVQECVYEY